MNITQPLQKYLNILKFHLNSEYQLSADTGRRSLISLHTSLVLATQ